MIMDTDVSRSCNVQLFALTSDDQLRPQIIFFNNRPNHVYVIIVSDLLESVTYSSSECFLFVLT